MRLLTPEERGAQAEAFSREADREDFWDTVRTVVPNYSELRGQLRDEALPAW